MNELTSEELKMRQAFDAAGYFTIKPEYGGTCRIKVTEIIKIQRGAGIIILRSGEIYSGLQDEFIDYVEKVFYDFIYSPK